MVRQANIDASHLPALSVPRFVGRTRELLALGEALGQPPVVILLEGEAGIGKTRLLREFLAAPSEGERRALVGACPPLREPYTLGAVVDAVREGVGNGSDLRLSGLGGALRPLFPEWAANLPPAPEPLEDATAARHRLFRAFVELLSRLDVAVLALEDVHWADEATLEFLLFLVSRRPQPVSVVLTYRPEEVPPDSLLLRLSSRLPADAHLVRLTLKPLGVGETATFVSSMLAEEHVSAEFASFLHARTEGVPLALEESVRLLHARADLIRQDGGWARRRLDHIEVPPTIRDAVLERVGRLRPDTRTVLHAAAVLAEPADYAILTAVTGLPEDRAMAQVADVVGCGLLREDERGQWSFRHSLACRAVYEAIPVQERRLMHRRAGQALENTALPPVAQLARHFREAGDAEASCRYAERAADLSTQSGDVVTSALLLHNLVTAVALPVEPLVRLVAKIHFQSLPGFDPYSKIIESLRTALHAQVLTPEQAALVRFQLGRVLMVAGAMEAGRIEIAEAVAHLAPDSLEAARARIFLAIPLADARPAAEHLRWLREAPAVAPSIAPHERLRLFLERAFALIMLGEEAGWVEARQFPEDPASAREAVLVAIGQTNVGEAAMRWGRYDEARARLAKALALVEKHELLGHAGSVASTQAHLDWFTGAWSGLADRVAALLDDDGVRLKDRAEAALVAGLIHAAAGDRERAEERLRLAGHDDQQRVEAAAALAQLHLHDGNVDEALRLTDEPAEIAVRSGVWPRATEVAPVRVAALVAAGQLDGATDLVTAFERAMGDKDAPAPQASLVVCRAILAEADGQFARAAALFARAAAAWQALPRPYDALLARERHARCLIAVGQHDVGRSALSEVSRALSDLGAHNDTDRVARSLHERGCETRVTRGRGRPSYGNQLSPRELEVARLLVGGRTNRQIADALVVSTQTVASQLKSAMRKLRVPSRTALAIRVVELGLVGEQGQPPAVDE
ncbi:helix-turn-helix transcriptional regulator [Micromonospora costi]|uniref:Helix-turn-helix transcriptional regulator n=1 Tax=Micromonospora costi TaxID=1530042 RepID=A0A3B0A3G9_9ACTN|nr:AAA family ATPase [Micromonospora costi]RKN55348.1 helix-turn-helix transcriptional regulator [Micromonospora costi]